MDEDRFEEEVFDEIRKVNKKGAEAIESAVRENNSKSHIKATIIWGSSDVSTEKMLESLGGQKEALLNWMDKDFEVRFSSASSEIALVELCVALPNPVLFRDLRNNPEAMQYVVQAAHGLASLVLWVDVDEGEMEEDADLQGELWAAGVKAVIPVESVNARTLVAAMEDVDGARYCIVDRLEELRSESDED